MFLNERIAVCMTVKYPNMNNISIDVYFRQRLGYEDYEKILVTAGGTTRISRKDVITILNSPQKMQFVVIL